MAAVKKAPKPKKWLRSERYLNREHSWLQFNSRVLEEAANPKNPLLERLKFLAIFESNLDEFYMVRVSGLIEQQESGSYDLSPDGLTPTEQLDLIYKTVQSLRNQAAELWQQVLEPELDENEVRILTYAELNPRQRKEAQLVYEQQIFPLCTPLVLHPANTVPFISNRSLNIAVTLQDESGTKLARVKVPNVLPRAIRVSKRSHHYVLAEDLIRENLQDLFPGVPILHSYMFRVLRDADIEIRELEAGDLVETIEQSIRQRRFGDPVLLEVKADMPAEIRERLMRLLDLQPSNLLNVEGLIGLDVLWQIAEIDKPALRFPLHHPHQSDQLASSADIFRTVAAGDVLLHHPFDSFRPIESFVEAAASDPNVVGIKMTLYRDGAESPLLPSLLDTADAGKQVAVMVELKARFDESNNLVWARALERAGVHLSYGFPDLKTHCKLCLVVRREKDGFRTYGHIGTGNYNPQTARLYTDLGLLTCNPDITQDIAELFNFLTGYSKQREYRKLLVAPINLRSEIFALIHREINAAKKNGTGRIILKMNSLVDADVIDALYEASAADVRVELIVRGICCLRPGVPDLSMNISVTSVVGRFLEHSRILYFHNGGKPEAYIGSADLMRRNLDRRIEVLTPVETPALVAHLRDDILESYLKDQTNTWVMSQDGKYKRKASGDEKHNFSAQGHLMEHPPSASLLPNDLAK